MANNRGPFTGTSSCNHLMKILDMSGNRQRLLATAPLEGLEDPK
jgi:hypothetical protein